MKLILSSTDLTQYGRPSKGDNELIRVAKDKDLEAKVVDPTKITYEFDERTFRVMENGEDLSSTDIILFRRSRGGELESYQFAKAMEEKGAVVIDPSKALIYPTAKLITQLDRTGEYIPKTLFLPNLTGVNLEGILSGLKFPFVLKPHNGTKGRGVKIVNNLDECYRTLAENFNNRMIAQEFIDIVSNIRVLTIGGKSVGAVFCKGTSDHFGLKEAERIAEKIIENDPAKIIGVDVVKDRQGKLYVLECNRNPDFTQMLFYGKPYSEIIIDYCIKTRKEKNDGKTEDTKLPRKSTARRLYEAVKNMVV